MRSTASILNTGMAELSASRPVKRSDLELLCSVEIGLHLADRLMPRAPAVDAWTLFSGYPFARDRGVVTDEDQESLLRAARYSLWTLRRRRTWTDALETYQEIDPHLRGYDCRDWSQPAQRRAVSVAPDRWDVYTRLLRQAPPLAGEPLPQAQPGIHRFPEGRDFATVRLPELTVSAPVGHDLDLLPSGGGKPISVPWNELLATARTMDEKEYRDRVKILTKAQLFTEQNGSFEESHDFSVAGVQHLLGIVGVGKSTLRDVLTVHAVKTLGLRVTLVVGDVAEILKLVKLFTMHGCRAAPVLGASSRERHAQRLHRRLAGAGKHNLLSHDDPGFAYLSTSCALNALRTGENQGPLAFSDAPCTRLQPRSQWRQAATEEGNMALRYAIKRVACPYWSQCPRHHGARELVKADIWVATPASLVAAAVPWPQNAERIRYMELACRRSDLIVVDEADRVQIQLDRMFAPAITLVGQETTSWLDNVGAHKIQELASGQRTQLSDRDVENWTAAVNTATTATDRLYAMLVQQPELRKWVRSGYFSAWILQHKLVHMRYPIPAGKDETDGEVDVHRDERDELTKILDEFRDNPFGDKERPRDAVADLVVLTNELLHTTYQRRTRKRVRDKLVELFALAKETENTYQETKEQERKRWLEEQTSRFEFTLLLSALEPTLALITAMWPRVEAALNLNFNDMYLRPPQDYGPMVPESPMGNVLGFQFLVKGRDEGGVRSGELRFFRCSGIGRELLRAMAILPTVDDRPGTNVLLMSGSSWAGSSSRYHIPVPVGIILKPPPAEIKRIADSSELRFEFVKTEACALQVSGARLDDRPVILQRMATALGESVDKEPSRLEQELLRLDEDRRHILLLVGSYEEAELVADTLHSIRRWRDRVLRLISDDADADVAPASMDRDDNRAGVLRRGDVDTLADTPAQILVAPLLAVERGHNILNAGGQAAIGSVYFLARPNPRPDDLGLAVHAINDWITRAIEHGRFRKWVRGEPTLDAAGRKIRSYAREEWYRVLARSLAWRRLGDDRESVTWDMLVLTWQVIGRLVRGGVPARVAFVDAAFAPNLAAGSPVPDTPKTSLLHSMHDVLQRYCADNADPDSTVTAQDRQLVQALYGPLWTALGRCLQQAVTEGDPT
ncbi:MAG: hypothetical protein JO115_11575 [Pseudonocardiales bacterium]|nr:hypothetical protein [Pseudonocardiales bacterium]